MSDSLWPHGLQHARLLCPSLSWSLLKLMSIESVMSSNHFILCCPLSLLPAVFPSIRIFSTELNLCIRRPKYWSFSISPSNEYSGVISFRVDWFDRLALKGLFSSTTVHKHQFGSQPSLCPALSSVHDCGKNSFNYMVLWRKSDVFYFLIRCLGFVIAFLPRSKCLVISWLQS